MQIDLKIPTYDVRLLNFDVIIRDVVKNSQLKCIEYSLDFDPISDVNCRRIFINYLVLEICDRIKSLGTSEKVVLYLNQNTCLVHSSNREEYIQLFQKVIDILSVKCIVNDVSFDMYADKLINRDGDSVYLFTKTYSKLTSTKAISKSNYNKLLNFLKTNGLSFLMNTYFNDTYNKMIVLR